MAQQNNNTNPNAVEQSQPKQPKEDSNLIQAGNNLQSQPVATADGQQSAEVLEAYLL